MGYPEQTADRSARARDTFIPQWYYVRRVKASTQVPKASQDVEQQAAANAAIVRNANFDTDSLRNIESFDDAIALVREQFGDVQTVSDSVLSDGFSLAEKESLEGKPFLIVDFRFNEGDYGNDFVSVNAIEQLPGGGIRKVVFNDGSTGVRDQLRKFQDETGRSGGLYVKRGLRASRYKYTDPNDGKEKPAVTFYLDTSE